MTDASHPSGTALIFDGPATGLRLVEQRRPDPAPGEIVVEVEAATLCASDLHTLHGRRSTATPTVLGHETVGRIVAWGPGPAPRDVAGQTLAAGDRITWAVVAACGVCPRCRAGLPQKCPAGIKYGHEPFRDRRAWTGGLATWVLLDPRTALVRLPEHLPASLAAPASCATATVINAWEFLGRAAGRRVMITGGGLLGLTAAALARSRHAADVVVVDPVAERRELAMTLGATAAVPPDGLPALAGETDLWLEASGQPGAWALVAPRLAIGARVALVGAVFPAAPVPFDMEQAVRRCLAIGGIHNYAPAHLAAAVSWLAGLPADHGLARLVGPWFTLADHAAAVAAAGRPGAVRVGFRPA